MRIVETEINDIPILNINESKLNLANDVIDYIQPIFSKEYKEKIQEVKTLKESLVNKQIKITKEKNELSELLKSFTKKNKERELLGKMGQLIQTGFIQDSMKNEMSNLLNSFENIPEEKITSYLNETIRLLSQKFAKS
jgi:predicted nuclease with TOPRIM domain